MTHRSLLSLVTSFLFVSASAVLAAGCSAPTDGAPEAASESAAQAQEISSAAKAQAGKAGASCDPSNAQVKPCATGFYCNTTSTTSCGSKGTCTASPGACPMIDAPVCGCDGQRYLNACWATIGAPNEPGTTSAFSLFVDPAPASVDGTWSRATVVGSKETDETLVLNADLTYSLTEETRCVPAPGRICSHLVTFAQTSGTYALGQVGVVLTATSSTNGDALATEFYLENGCPAGGLVMGGTEPPVTGTDVFLSKN